MLRYVYDHVPGAELDNEDTPAEHDTYQPEPQCRIRQAFLPAQEAKESECAERLKEHREDHG